MQLVISGINTFFLSNCEIDRVLPNRICCDPVIAITDKRDCTPLDVSNIRPITVVVLTQLTNIPFLGATESNLRYVFAWFLSSDRNLRNTLVLEF